MEEKGVSQNRGTEGREKKENKKGVGRVLLFLLEGGG